MVVMDCLEEVQAELGGWWEVDAPLELADRKVDDDGRDVDIRRCC